MLDPAPEPLLPASPVEPLPAAPRRPLAVERLGALLEVFLCSGFPTQLLVFATLTQLGLQARTADGALHPPFIVALALVDMVLVLGLVAVFLRAHHESVREFLTGGRPVFREAAFGLALIPTVFVLVILVLAVLLTLKPSLNNVPVNPFGRMMQTPADAAVFALVVVLAGGVREEIQRGFMIRRFDQYLGGAALGIGMNTVVFGLGHLEQGYAAAIATGTLGLFWGIVYAVRRSVIGPMVSHAGFNLGQLVKFVGLS